MLLDWQNVVTGNGGYILPIETSMISFLIKSALKKGRARTMCEQKETIGRIERQN